MALSSLSDSRGRPLLRLAVSGVSCCSEGRSEEAGYLLGGAVEDAVVEVEEVVFEILEDLVVVAGVCFNLTTADGVTSVLRRFESGSSSLGSSLRGRLLAEAAAASLLSNTGNVFCVTRLLKSEGEDSSLGVTENAMPCTGRRRGQGWL